MSLRHRHDLWLTRPAVSFGGGTTRESGGNQAYAQLRERDFLGSSNKNNEAISQILDHVQSILHMIV